MARTVLFSSNMIMISVRVITSMAVLEVLAAWFILSLSGALAPGPLSAACVMQASRRGRLHGILPMVGHAIVELGIVAAIILSVQIFIDNPLIIDLLMGFGGIVIILFGILALRDYRFSEKSITSEEFERGKSTVVEATFQGAIISILSPYFLLWWFGVGLANVTILIAELQVGLGTVFLAGVLIYLTHISTDFIFGAFLSVSSDSAAKKIRVGDINWINVIIGMAQVILGLWFLLQAVI
jgi:threonine/homoserine/homoserine lactone efflux protein